MQGFTRFSSSLARMLAALSGTVLPILPLLGQTAALPSESEYVIVKDGHLSINGKRERYWAVIGKLYISAGVTSTDTPEQRAAKLDKSRRGTDVLLQRFSNVGFNACRMWDAVPNTEDYIVGDGSKADCVDYFIAGMKKRGYKIWLAGLNNAGSARPENVDIIADPSTAEDWQSAVAAAPKGEISLRESVARVWDPRLEALHLERMKAIATHTNKHTGLRWCDDPVFAVWELTNEEWWMRKMLAGRWQKEHPYFRNQLIERWNKWLAEKHGSSENLASVWGKLLPGEDLSKGTVLFMPMAGKSNSSISLNDSNAAARASLESIAQEYSRKDFSASRASDVIEFLLQLQLAHKMREAKEVKSWGRSTHLSPLVYDTGIGYEIQSQYMHQLADAVAHDAYVNGWGPVFQEADVAAEKNPTLQMLKQLDAERIGANAGPWVNWLLKPPGISQGVPWLEHNRVEGKPFLVYETQIQQPAKYRADFPLRLAALAAIQDWDWISWHYFSTHDEVGLVERPFDRPLDVTVGAHPQGYHFTYDEVQNSMMRAASSIFREHLLKSASDPTEFIFGRKSLYHPDSMDYAGSYGSSGMDMLQTTYQHGVRISVDPNREDDVVRGPVVKFSERHSHNPYTPTEEIVFDWKKGFLRIDSPAVASFTGLLTRYGNSVQFENGIILRNITIKNAPGIFDPVTPEENYIAFALYSLDGKPLAEAKRASISLMSTSFNSGFELGNKTIEPNKPPSGSKAGTLPVLFARVGATVEGSPLKGMRYVLRDWHMKELGQGVIGGNSLTIPADQPVFIVELSRD